MSLIKLARLPSGRLLNCFNCDQQLLHSSISPFAVSRRAGIHGEYRRPGKPKEDKFPWQKINFDFSKGLEGIKNNITLLRKEFSDRWVGPEGKPLLQHMLEQNRVIWEFKGPESLEQWIISSDHEIGGKSEVYLKMGKTGQNCFLYGNLNSTPPRDGETRYSGYCTMRSKQPQVRLWGHVLTLNEMTKVLSKFTRLSILKKFQTHFSFVLQSSFNRKKHYDWSPFNTLHLRVRGDGRPWMINIASETYFSHQKDDIYCYFLYTRGGPYWQEVKVGSGNLRKTRCINGRSSAGACFTDTVLQVLPHKSWEGARWSAPALAGQGLIKTFHPGMNHDPFE